jgi:hypothetical protein
MNHAVRSSRAVKLSLCVATVVGMLVLAGCPQGVHISDLNRNPGRYQNKEVGVTGTVVQSFGLLGQGAFEIDDGTGRIWVLSEGYGVPGKGVRIGVAGHMVGGVTLGTRSFATAIRQSRRPHY